MAGDGQQRAKTPSYEVPDNSGIKDYIGIVFAREGASLSEGDIASRIGGFKDIEKLEAEKASDDDLIAAILKSNNQIHSNYQDSQAFLDAGGQVGLQHDPLLYGTYLINPASFSIEYSPMLVVEQGEVAVIKAYVGSKEVDESGEEFKFGSLVKPGRRGVWRTPLHTGKYAINPRCYEAVKVKTSIINLNWADATSSAHGLDRGLSSIHAKSKEGFEIIIDLQVQIHIPDTQASRVISSVGTMENLINDILQAAVGNHFRDTSQSMSATEFINDRKKIQQDAYNHIKVKLADYGVETVGVYIQDVIYPEELTSVLKKREIANQETETYKSQMEAEKTRADRESQKGNADKQAALAESKVGIEIAKNEADAKIQKAAGEAKYETDVGFAKANVIKANQLAEAAGYEAKCLALGPDKVAMIESARVISENWRDIVLPKTVVMSGGLQGLVGTAMNALLKVSEDASGDEGSDKDAKTKRHKDLEKPIVPEDTAFNYSDMANHAPRG